MSIFDEIHTTLHVILNMSYIYTDLCIYMCKIFNFIMSSHQLVEISSNFTSNYLIFISCISFASKIHINTCTFIKNRSHSHPLLSDFTNTLAPIENSRIYHHPTKKKSKNYISYFFSNPIPYHFFLIKIIYS